MPWDWQFPISQIQVGIDCKLLPFATKERRESSVLITLTREA